MLINVSILSCLDQNTGRSHIITIDKSSFERVEVFKYLGTTITNQTIQEETEVTECLLSLGAASFVFQFAVQKFKD
jgi:hypothetical protein